MHYCNKMSFDDIADVYNCSRQRIDQIEKKAMDKLHRSYRVKRLNPYLK